MNKLPYVRVTKIDKTENALHETSSREEWQHGQKNLKSPFVGYWLEGNLLTPMSVGGVLWVDRKVRNGESVEGYFRSSPIIKIDGKEVHTNNSVYLVDFIK